MSETPLLFVYGTLRRRGGAPHQALLRREARWAGPARVRGALYRVADYPAAVPDGEGWVLGELYRMLRPEPLLAALDVYEEVAPPGSPPGEYRREVCPVWPLADAAAPLGEAWVYLYNPAVAGLERIANGDFLRPAAS